ncbi:MULTISPECIES: hypothetical protein [Heyndrickxia]|uniref:DUF4190 domain-containing protein n=2 Tax=Heyndrickxia TaxID=2837504 RepID=A0AB37HJK0_9BACI|nr:MULTISPECIES: hypothetical protein [Heyndrickxia]MBL5779717.1 DUF4190 domain-containing protein [Heyndrickxia sporothermodurans]MBL5783626.1 DUF4190 domain-containing protein [Heyndrickxia sporothermodurans]MBL5793737.1 DUF4190 domain-containing protein [Heyndrickxia sporothermodurans]MBL5804873.1 DUF4190 domain-containing protein [Heyndrickxia sporothermodurans]MBL5808524.1 DUF4190 domain-containing protein [Heyndrickxia sporothermodurans]
MTEKINRKAIVTFILGVLSIFIPLLGFALGILGIIFSNFSSNEIKVYKERGKILFILGCIFCVIGILIQIVEIVGFIGIYFFGLDY